MASTLRQGILDLATTIGTEIKNVKATVSGKASTTDPRFTDSRTPSGAAGGSLGGSYPNPTVVLQNVADTRAAATIPNDYGAAARWQFKQSNVIGLPGGTAASYAFVNGFRGYSDSSGGPAYEIAYWQGDVYKRYGLTTTWGAWVKVMDATNPVVFDNDSRLGAGMLKRLDSGVGVAIYRDVFDYYLATAGTSGSGICVDTQIPFTGAMIRGHVEIGGYNGVNTVSGDFTVYAYNTGGGTIYQPVWVQTGNSGITLRMAKTATNTLVLIFESPDPWYYPRLSVTSVQVGYSDPGATAFNGWIGTMRTTAQITSTYGATIVNCASRLIAQEIASKEPSLGTAPGNNYYLSGLKQWIGLATVATSGSAADLINRLPVGSLPATIPAANLPSGMTYPDTGWVTLATGSGYNIQSGTPQARRVGDVVQIRAIINKAGGALTASANNPGVLVLPSQFWPSQTIYFQGASGTAATAVRVTITSAGAVDVLTQTGTTSYAAISHTYFV